MMLRSLQLLMVLGAVSAVATPADAGWLVKFAGNVRRDFKRNNCWPEPFIRSDRDAVLAPFAVMVANGWRVQNTLSDHHFDQQQNTLNEAGRQKIRAILTEAPMDRRAIFVLRGETPEKTAARIDAAQQFATQLLPEGGLPEVSEVSIPPRGWSADYIDDIGRKFRASTPSPRLPELQEDQNQ